MAKGIVYASWHKDWKNWILLKSKEDDLRSGLIICDLPDYVNRPLKKKKIYKITCREA